MTLIGIIINQMFNLHGPENKVKREGEGFVQHKKTQCGGQLLSKTQKSLVTMTFSLNTKHYFKIVHHQITYLKPLQ